MHHKSNVGNDSSGMPFWPASNVAAPFIEAWNPFIPHMLKQTLSRHGRRRQAQKT